MGDADAERLCLLRATGRLIADRINAGIAQFNYSTVVWDGAFDLGVAPRTWCTQANERRQNFISAIYRMAKKKRKLSPNH